MALRLMLCLALAVSSAQAANLLGVILTAEPNRSLGYYLSSASCGSVPAGATSFLSTAPDITAWVEIANPAPGTSWEFHWINPYGVEEDGNVTRTYTYTTAQGNWARVCNGDALAWGIGGGRSNRNKSPIPGRWEVRVEMAGQTKSAFFDVTPVTCPGGYTVSKIDLLPPRHLPDGTIHPEQPKGVPGNVYYSVNADHGCIWSAVSNSPWIAIVEMCRNPDWDPFCDRSVASGFGYFHYRWDSALAGTAQTGSITVGGQTIAAGPPGPGGLRWIQSTIPATGVAGAVAQGGLFSVFGYGFCPGAAFTASAVPWTTNANGVSLSVHTNDFAAAVVGVPPLHYAGPSGDACQVNAQLPWNVQPGTYLLRLNGTLWAGTIEVVSLQPAFYAAPPAYPVLLQILNRNYLLVSEDAPVYPGETLIGYADGLGQTTPPRVTGQAAPVGPGQFASVNATVQAFLKSCQGESCAEIPITVVYAIAYPGSPAAYQLAFTLPEFTVDPLRRYSLAVRVAGVSAPDMPLFLAPRPGSADAPHPARLDPE